MSLICADWTYLLNGMFAEVQYEVGLGRRKRVYQRACQIWLQRHGIPHACRPACELRLGDSLVTMLYPDLVVWNAVAISLKSVCRKLSALDRHSLFDWMKCRNLPYGLLVNMGLDDVECYRFLYEPTPGELVENWDYWSGIRGSARRFGRAVCRAMRMIHSAHQTGYQSEVCEKLIAVALDQQSVKYQLRPRAGSYFHGTQVDDDELECIVVENSIVIGYMASPEKESFYVSINRTLSYMRSLGKEWGIAVHFGKDQLRVTALRSQ